jgi:hypothetical protein
MCTRDTTDPLVRLFLDKYGLHLLPQPREGVAVGDVYPHYGGTTHAAGRYSALLPRPFKLPKIHSGEKAADISGTVSDAVSAKVGLSLLEGFLGAIGAAGWISKLRLSMEGKDAASLRFRFADPLRDHLDPLQLELALREYKPDWKKSLFDPERRYFMTTAVVRSRAISVTAEDRNARAVDVDVDALKVLSEKVGVKVEKSAQSEITFSGGKPLAFGIELHEVLYQPAKRNRLGLAGTSGAVRARAAGDGEEPATRASFIGDAVKGDIFLRVGGPG